MEKGVVIKSEKKTVTIEEAFKIIVNLMKQEKQRREDAEKALEFYADQNSWRKDSQDFGSSMSTMWQISGNDLYEQNEATQYGGAAAKAHFEKYKQ